MTVYTLFYNGLRQAKKEDGVGQDGGRGVVRGNTTIRMPAACMIWIRPCVYTKVYEKRPYARFSYVYMKMRGEI